MKLSSMCILFSACIVLGFSFSPHAEMIGQSRKMLPSQGQESLVGNDTDTIIVRRVWENDKSRLAELKKENLSSEEDCAIRWKLLWENSKQGNLEARATLSMLTFPVWPFSPQIVMPGRSGDIISSFRDSVILAIHSNGYQFSEEKQQKKYEEHLSVLFSELLKEFPWSTPNLESM